MRISRNKLPQTLGVFGLTFTLFGSSTLAAEKEFTDISIDYWAKTEIDYLSEQGIINGYPDGSFKPNQAVTRYQAAAMLVKVLDLPLVEVTPVQFNDIATDSPRYKLAATMYESGLIRGSNGNFRPNESLTRAQMATVLTRAFDLNRSEDFYFTDIQPDYWNYTEIAALADSGITGGKGDGTFAPSEPTSRASFSVFLYRTMDGERQELEPLAHDPSVQNDFNNEPYVLDGKEYYRKDQSVVVREGDNEKPILSMSSTSELTELYDLVTFSGSNVFFSDGDDVYSYDLLSDKSSFQRTKHVYEGDDITKLVEYQGKLIIKDGVLRVLDLKGDPVEDKIDYYRYPVISNLDIFESKSWDDKDTLIAWEDYGDELPDVYNMGPIIQIYSRTQ